MDKTPDPRRSRENSRGLSTEKESIAHQAKRTLLHCRTAAHRCSPVPSIVATAFIIDAAASTNQHDARSHRHEEDSDRTPFSSALHISSLDPLILTYACTPSRHGARFPSEHQTAPRFGKTVANLLGQTYRTLISLSNSLMSSILFHFISAVRWT